MSEYKFKVLYNILSANICKRAKNLIKISVYDQDDKKAR